MIKKTKKGYVLFTKNGKKKLGGPYRSRAQAVKREKQVQYFKNAKEDVDAWGLPLLEEQESTTK